MKKTLIKAIPLALPKQIEGFISGADVYDSSCSPEARVYFIDKENGYYLKTAPAGTLSREAQMTSYFHSKGLGVSVLQYSYYEGKDWLLSAAADGDDCTYSTYLSDPKRLCDTIAESLRALHELDASDCPIKNRNADYLSLAEHNFKAGKFDLSLFDGDLSFSSAEHAYSVLEEGKGDLRSDVLLHGDYCLPNIILKDWKLSSYIDLGNGGIGDRHIDLFWGAWTLRFNLGTDAYRERFFDAYGREKVNTDTLRVIAAAEVFG